MRTAALVSVAAASAFLLTAAPANAGPPEEEVTFSVVIEDLEGEQCGFPVRWEINGSLRPVLITDETGAVVRIIARVTEDNVITNLATGATAVDRPKFNQVVQVLPDGSFGEVTTTGLYANAGRGQDQVKDVGRFVYSPRIDGQRTVQFRSARHALLDEAPLLGEEWL